MIRTLKWSLLGVCVFVAYVSAALPTQSHAATQLETSVLNGIDVLEKNGFRQLEGRKIGLITNQTGINRKGISDIQLFHEASNVNLLAIFSPEHGLLGKLDIESIENSEDSLTGIEIFSLYGSTRTPTAAMLSGIDTLVFDIQDIGSRFYTYISTMGEAMQAAAKHGTRFVVLDRPNPINGVRVSGPVLDAGSESFVGFHRLPVRHGMTIGELALMFNTELALGLDLEIIPVEGWQREDYFDTSGLPWINPSPNMRSLNEAILYPGIGLLETTNLSVGRGTSSPFELIGAPWLNGQQLAAELNQLGLPGILFKATQFTPVSSKFKAEVCAGVNFFVTDRNQFNSVRTGIEIALKLRSLYPNIWETEKLNRLLGNVAVHQAILDGRSYAEIEMLFHDDLTEFMKRRAPHLIYP
jgi:uncharacterized protein YbbC (DUF1343 family)